MQLVLVSLLAGACDAQMPATGPVPTASQSAVSTSTATPAGQATVAPDLPLRAEGMRLVGSVPGSNADFAFWGDLAIVTNVVDWDRSSADDGFVVIDISDAASPTVVGRFACAGSFQDVSVWDGLAVLSTDRITDGEACGAQEAKESDATAFAGLRIVSIADPANPVLLANVPTGVQDSPGVHAVRGSHTNTLVPDLENRRLLVYASMYYYPDSIPDATIVEIPLDDPAAARAIGTFDNGVTDTCHDITVHLASRLAACSGYLGGLTLFDISDLARPEVVSHVTDPQMTNDGASWHSAVFSNDGRSMAVNAEIFDGVCHGGTDSTLGALRFFDVADPKRPELRSVFQLPRGTTDGSCYAHLSGIVPLSGDRDVLVSGWVDGGVNLVDFTDLANPRELAYWVGGEADAGHSIAIAAYWYNGRAYAGTARGFEVFEVDAGLLDDAPRLPHLNPQTHEGG